MTLVLAILWTISFLYNAYIYYITQNNSGQTGFCMGLSLAFAISDWFDVLAALPS